MEQQLRAIIMPLSEELIKQLAAAVEERGQEKVTLWWLEMRLVAVLAVLAVGIMKGMLEGVMGRGYEGSRMACPGCGGRMKFQRYARRPVISGFGRFSYERAYYYCPGCGQGRAPLDQRLETSHRQVSPRRQRVIGFLSGHLSFPVVGKSLKESLGIEVSDETIRQVATEWGQQARDWEEQQRQVYEEAPVASQPVRAHPKTWILEIDGKKIGYQDGSWRETKVGVIYELSDRVEIHTGRHELVKRELMARRCDWLEFSYHFGAAMRRSGIQPGDRLVVLADGAKAIEQIFELVAPEATSIRDFYHVAERLYAIGELRYGAQTPHAHHWIGLKLEQLKRSEVESIVRSIAHLKFSTQEAQQTRTEVLGYLQNHRWAMDYATYQQQHLPIGSGAVEGGCRLIGWRTNGCGRRWSLAGGDAIVALRVAVLNDRLNLLRPRPSFEVKMAA